MNLLNDRPTFDSDRDVRGYYLYQVKPTNAKLMFQAAGSKQARSKARNVLNVLGLEDTRNSTIRRAEAADFQDPALIWVEGIGVVVPIETGEVAVAEPQPEPVEEPAIVTEDELADILEESNDVDTPGDTVPDGQGS